MNTVSKEIAIFRNDTFFLAWQIVTKLSEEFSASIFSLKRIYLREKMVWMLG
jgi:hypothetical protein